MSKPTMHFRPIALTQALFAMVVLLFLSSTTAIAQDDQKAVIRGRSAAAAEAGLGDLYAVVVGISKYKNPKIPPLKVSDKDAKDFAEFLNGQEGLFKKVHVALLTNELATKAEVEKHLYHKLRQAHKDDTVVVFLSGHGSDDPTSPGDFFFLTHDADPDYLEATSVNMSSQRFTQRMESRRILLIADACHAGGFSTQVSKAVVRSRENLLRMFKESEGKVFVTSSRADELSQEKPELGNSIFTYYLIEGLRGAADQDMDGVVTLNELYDYVYKSTRQATAGYQSPQMEGKIVGPFALALCKTHPGPVPTTARPRVPPPARAVEPPDEMARLRKRAESGDATAQFELGIKYEYGLGVAKDKSEALKWQSKASLQGNQEAKQALARLAPSPSFAPSRPSPQKPLQPATVASQRPSQPVKRDPVRYATLIEAATKGHMHEVRRLLSEGAHVNAKWPGGWTALICAVHSGNAEVVQLLLDRGADINAATDDGRTALHHAAYYGNSHTLQLLLERGANLDAKDKEGRTAMDLAREGGKEEIATILSKYRGRSNRKGNSKKDDPQPRQEAPVPGGVDFPLLDRVGQPSSGS